MKGFVQWADEDKFWIKDYYDEVTRHWVGGGGWLELQNVQRRILEHCLTPDEEGRFPYTTIIYSTTKKSGKSAIAAAVTAWGAEELSAGSEIFIAANSREQAEGRIMRDLKYHVNHSGRRYPIPLQLRDDFALEEEKARVLQYQIKYPNETFVQALAQNHSAAAGSRHSLTVWDELWGFTTPNERKMWDELTPIPTVDVSLRFIATYAGFEGESDLLWDLYVRNVHEDEHPEGLGERVPGLEDLPAYRNGRVFVFWDHENRMPWQTEQYLEQQFAEERAIAYLRFHENRWVNSKEVFIPVTWWNRSVQKGIDMGIDKPATTWWDHPYKRFQVFVGIDASTKRDSTALSAVIHDGATGLIVELYHEIWLPEHTEEDELFDLWETVGEKVVELNDAFDLQEVVYDPTQMHQVAVMLEKKGIKTHEFTQSSKQMTQASQNLYDVLSNRQFVTYEDERTREQVRKALAVITPTGFRIVKMKSKARSIKIDYTIALAMAVNRAIDQGGYVGKEEVTIQSNFADTTQFVSQLPGENELPWEFREELGEFDAYEI